MFTVDVGNSSIGIGVWNADDVELLRFTDVDRAAEVLTGAADAISVSEPTWQRLVAALARLGRPAPRRLSGVPVRLGDERLAHTAGADRLANVAAVSAGPVVIVDAGTAVTIDVVDGAGVYRGGFIAPGPAVALAGLVRAAPALPALPGEPVPLEIAAETHGALSAGAWGHAVGGVDRLVEVALDLLGTVDDGALIIATGGWGGAWARCSRHEVILVDAVLVHRGIRRWGRQP